MGCNVSETIVNNIVTKENEYDKGDDNKNQSKECQLFTAEFVDSVPEFWRCQRFGSAKTVQCVRRNHTTPQRNAKKDITQADSDTENDLR